MAQATYSKATKSAIHDHFEFKIKFDDLVEQYLSHHETTNAAFHHYVHNVTSQTSIVMFKPSVILEHVRKINSILFLAIVAIAHEKDVKSNLIIEVKKILAQQVMIDDKHFVKLIQVMLIMSLFY